MLHVCVGGGGEHQMLSCVCGGGEGEHQMLSCVCVGGGGEDQCCHGLHVHQDFFSKCVLRTQECCSTTLKWVLLSVLCDVVWCAVQGHGLQC